MRVYNTGNHFEMVFVRSSSDIIPSLYERLPHAAEVIENNNPSNTSSIAYVFANFTYRHGIMMVSKPYAYKP